MSDVNMASSESEAGRTACHSVSLGIGRRIVFVTEGPDDAPDKHVRRELDMVGRLHRDTPTRGPAGELATMVVSGIIGGAAWATVLSSIVATQRYVQRLTARRKRLDSADQVIARLREVLTQVYDSAPPTPAQVTVRREDDGTWTATMRYSRTIRARLDSTGAVIVLDESLDT